MGGTPGAPPQGALARAALLSGAAGSGGRHLQPGFTPATAPPPQEHARAAVLPGSACAAGVSAAPGAGGTPGGAQGALGRAALLSSASAGSQLMAQACKTAKPATAAQHLASTAGCRIAPRSAPPTAAVQGEHPLSAAGNNPALQPDHISDTPEKRPCEAPNATQCSTPELQPHSSQLSQSSIATPVTPQSPPAYHAVAGNAAPGAAVPSTAAGDCDAGQEQSGTRCVVISS